MWLVWSKLFPLIFVEFYLKLYISQWALNSFSLLSLYNFTLKLQLIKEEEPP